MANVTVANRSDVFPVGTSVSLFPRSSSRAHEVKPNDPTPGTPGPPWGTAIATATVAANGSLTFTGAAANTEYIAYAQVGGVHRELRVSNRQYVPPSGWSNVVASRRAAGGFA